MGTGFAADTVGCTDEADGVVLALTAGDESGTKLDTTAAELNGTDDDASEAIVDGVPAAELVAGNAFECFVDE